jgi:dTDP-glucose 4,6-dehydratase
VRILVTGGAGFIGSHLCERLLSEGHQLVALDNLITGNANNIAALASNPDFVFIRHDVSEYISVSGEIDAVMHLASPASPNPASPYGYPQLPIQTLKAGALGTHNTLGVARARRARYLLASTSEIYGDPQVYDEAKRFAEAMTMAYQRYHDMSTRIARIFNTYGPRMRVDDGRVIPNFLCQAIQGKPLSIYGDGSQTRSFCFVDDMVEALYLLLMAEVPDPINLGNPSEISIRDLGALINRLTGNTAGMEFMPGRRDSSDPQQRKPDITRAKRLLGWEPKLALEEGLIRTIADFRNRL